MQARLLDKYPDANLRVYAIWFNMLPSDARSKWPPDLLDDPRVIHRWDEKKVVGTWYAQRTSSIRARLTPGSRLNEGPVLWDAYLLYGADARWSNSGTGLLHVGRTIVAGRDTLEAAFQKLFGGSRNVSFRVERRAREAPSGHATYRRSRWGAVTARSRADAASP